MMQLRLKGKWMQVLAVALVFTVSFFVGKGIASWGKPDAAVADNGQKSADATGADLPSNRLNVLLMGIDARPGEKDARSDSLIVVSIDRSTKKIAMLSVPRDSLVDIPGHGKDKINSANAVGGADLARKTVEDLLGIQIPYYVKTNFDGFKEIVDTLGGVNLDVEKRMYYPAEGINLRPGEQRLNGSNALAYVRFRYDALGDISRTQRQQKFLTALAKETLQAKTIIKLPRLVPQLMDAVETNLGVSDAILLARAASSIDSENIMTATLPGAFLNYKGVSYWKVDDAKTKDVLRELLEGVKVAAISGPDINVPAQKKTYKKVYSKPAQVGIEPKYNAPAEKEPSSYTPENTNTGQVTPQQDAGTGQSTPQPPSAPGSTPGNSTSGNPGQPAESGQSDQVFNETPGQPNDAQSGNQPPSSTANQGSAPVAETTPESGGNTGYSGTSNTVTTPRVDNVNQG